MNNESTEVVVTRIETALAHLATDMTVVKAGLSETNRLIVTVEKLTVDVDANRKSLLRVWEEVEPLKSSKPSVPERLRTIEDVQLVQRTWNRAFMFAATFVSPILTGLAVSFFTKAG
jgi:uncharacterized protein involved in exopolysaccharide biosynthesis